jgi:hypothetical protein
LEDPEKDGLMELPNGSTSESQEEPLDPTQQNNPNANDEV